MSIDLPADITIGFAATFTAGTVIGLTFGYLAGIQDANRFRRRDLDDTAHRRDSRHWASGAACHHTTEIPNGNQDP
jgi:hypothetical protein